MRFGFFLLPAIDLLFLLWQITLNFPPCIEEKTWASAGINPSLDSNSALHTPLKGLLPSSITGAGQSAADDDWFIPSLFWPGVNSAIKYECKIKRTDCKEQTESRRNFWLLLARAQHRAYLKELGEVSFLRTETSSSFSLNQAAAHHR